VDARVGVGLGVGFAKERQELATPRKLSAAEHLVSPEAAPVTIPEAKNVFHLREANG
jgi:hypothetical protein